MIVNVLASVVNNNWLGVVIIFVVPIVISIGFVWYMFYKKT